jgi:hypothetical protein
MDSAAEAAPNVKPKTRSPGVKAVMEGPVEEMMPAKSWPMVSGSLSGLASSVLFLPPDHEFEAE